MRLRFSEQLFWSGSGETQLGAAKIFLQQTQQQQQQVEIISPIGCRTEPQILFIKSAFYSLTSKISKFSKKFIQVLSLSSWTIVYAGVLCGFSHSCLRGHQFEIVLFVLYGHSSVLSINTRGTMVRNFILKTKLLKIIASLCCSLLSCFHLNGHR